MSKKLRVGILTMHRVHNCGSYLQAYALQQAIETMGCDCEIIDYLYPNALHGQDLYYYPITFFNSVNHIFHNVYHKRWELVDRQLHEIIWVAMLNIKLRLSKKTYTTANELMSNPPQYDVYLLGSDQVWNERFMKCDPSFFLAFAPKEATKMTFASSVPNTHFSELFIKNMEGYVTGFKSIATRENASAQVLVPYVGKDVQCVLDPVFLLTNKEWNERLGLRTRKKGYILCFVLNYMGYVKDEVQGRLDAALEKHGDLKVYANSDYIRHPKPTKVGDVLPTQFVELIANAAYVITDSFHATAFALLYGIPVMPMISDKQHDIRIQDMCERLGDVDAEGFVHVNADKLEKEITKMLDYLSQIVE